VVLLHKKSYPSKTRLYKDLILVLQTDWKKGFGRVCEYQLLLTGFSCLLDNDWKDFSKA